jgi:SagB-type dehydrogenase family enzyme
MKRGARVAPTTLAARLAAHVVLEPRANGEIVACFRGHRVGLGKLSVGATERAQHLRSGLPLRTLSSGVRDIDREVHELVRRLAGHGLLEYRLGPRPGEDEVVIEPQRPDYWPRTPQLGNTDILVLSRFAYLRRRANEMVLESPRAGALFKIVNPRIASVLASLASPQRIGPLRRQDGFPGLELLALLLDCQILFKLDSARASGMRPEEGDDNLVLWDFHDLLFHARSTEGRHANPLGGVYPYAGVIAPQPAVRPRWRGKRIDLRQLSTSEAGAIAPAARLLQQRHSTRSFDDQRPITLAELARLLDSTARVRSRWRGTLDLGETSPMIDYAVRPYPSGGGSYELELYLAVEQCDGLARGFYHYDAGGHALIAIGVRPHVLEALLKGAEFAMGAPAAPQILITIAARFGRVSWKYSSLAYALVLKDVGVLMQTLYLMATDMGLGGCAIGSVNIDLFAQMTGIEFHVEGPVGQFALGRAVSNEAGSTPGT